MLDLNGFKQVNDTYGHEAGDDLLKQFSTELRSASRATDVVGRWGGDEFIVVLDGNLTEAQSHVERMQKWVFGSYTLQIGSNARSERSSPPGCSSIGRRNLLENNRRTLLDSRSAKW